jgi:hypothetical protein
VTRLRSAPYACLALVVALALGAAACSSSASGGNALDVSGTTLSNRDFRDRLDAIAKSKTYVAKLTGADGSALKTEGVSAGTYSTWVLKSVL